MNNKMKTDKEVWLCQQVAWQCQFWRDCFLAHLLLRSWNFGISLVYCVLVVSKEKILISVLHSFGQTQCSFVVNMLNSQHCCSGWRDGGMFVIIWWRLWAPTLYRQGSASRQDFYSLRLCYFYFYYLSFYCSSFPLLSNTWSFSYLLLFFFHFFFSALPPSG